MLVGRDVKGPIRAAELHQVYGCEVARGIVQEHVFRARIRGVDPSGLRTGTPAVVRGVELYDRIGRGPGGQAALRPEVTCIEGFTVIVVPAAKGTLPRTVRNETTL